MLRHRVFLLLLVAALCSAATSHAALRSPQIPVGGTALATFFASKGQTIDVNTEQLDLQTLSMLSGLAQVHHVFGPDDTRTIGAYNAGLVAPPLYAILPGSATPGTFAEITFFTGPDRLRVILFDPAGFSTGFTQYVGADGSSFGFYTQAPDGNVIFSQDARNPSGEPRMLAYSGTGTWLGWTWLAWETGAAPGGGDFADYVAAVNLPPGPTPVHRTDWATLKQRFR